MYSPKKSMAPSALKNFSTPSIPRRSSIFHGAKPVLRFLPSYRLEPRNPFNRELCENIMKKVVDSEMQYFNYTNKTAPNLCKQISEEIKMRIKMLNFDRYKYVCIVTIGQMTSQGYCSKVKFLWDAEKDQCVSYVHDKPNVFAVATLYALYYD